MAAHKANEATATRQGIYRTSPANLYFASANGSLARDCDSDASDEATRNIDKTTAHISSSILDFQKLHISAYPDGHKNPLTHSAMKDKKPTPGEVWLKVIECLDPKALKNARLVNKQWRDFVGTLYADQAHTDLLPGYTSSLSHGDLQSGASQHQEPTKAGKDRAPCEIRRSPSP
jgi:hypothetical protein